MAAALDRGSWTPAPIFGLVQQVGNISRADIEATLNMGVGMALVVPEASVDAVLATASGRGLSGWVLGATAPSEGAGRVQLTGAHPL